MKPTTAAVNTNVPYTNNLKQPVLIPGAFKSYKESFLIIVFCFVVAWLVITKTIIRYSKRHVHTYCCI